MGFFTNYLRSHFQLDENDEYDVVPAFRESEILNRDLAEKQFETEVRGIACWSPSDLQQWALQQRNDFPCLHKAKYTKFWRDTIVKEVLDVETEAYYRNRLEVATPSQENEGHASAASGFNGGDGDVRIPEEEDDQNEASVQQNSDLSLDWHPSVEPGAYNYTNANIVTDSISKHADIANASWCFPATDSESAIICNVIDEMNTFRNLALSQDPKTLSDLRVLAVNHVFLITKDRKTSFTGYLPIRVHGRVIEEVMNDPVPQLSDRSILWCTKLAMTRNENWFSIQKVTIPFLAMSAETMDECPTDVIVANILHRAALSFSQASPNVSIEDSFVHNFVANLFENIFHPGSILEGSWANGQLGGKRKREETNNAFRSDYVLFVSHSSHRLDLTCAEAKSPKTNLVTFPRSDLVKIGQELRWMLNTLVKRGVEYPVVCAILVRGYELSTYKMEIIAPHVYRMVELSRTAMFRKTEELTLVPTIVSNLLQVKNITASTADKALNRLLQRSKNISVTPRPPVSWLYDDMPMLIKRTKKE